MKTVFADTGYGIALLNPRDDWHSRAVDASKALGKVRLRSGYIPSDVVPVSCELHRFPPTSRSG